MADKINSLAALLTSIGVLGGILIAVIAWITKINNAMRCLLRSQILQTYNKNVEDKKVQRYEFENVTLLYSAYKALHGNSFVEKIYEDIKSWEVTQ